ncbi:MAG: hypothetical protein WC606_00360 [Candidatus Absconditabacterales bacterium]|jgi:hypothetical protein
MKIFEIDTSKNPHLGNLQKLLSQVLSQAIGEEVAKNISPIRMSQELVIKRLQEGKLKGIEDDMKLSKTNFFHYYTEDMKEVIVQTSPTKFAVFSE